MASHVIDFLLIGNNFSSPEMRSVWSEKQRLACQVEVEVALAQAEGELGIIPAAAAEQIALRANPSLLDLDQLVAAGAVMQHSLMPTLTALQEQCGDAGQYIHYGATTQDIVDTATVLQLKQSFAIIQRDARLVAVELKTLADRYRATLMVGRSHGMQALPTTFGFKVAVWLDEFVRHLTRLKEIKSRVLTGNINGAIGTYASFGPQGPEVERRTLARLGLNAPAIGWQSARDRFSEYGAVVALISGTLGKIGNELYNLMRSEINEVSEPFSSGKIGSTTMPHKRNPAALEGLASLTPPVLKSVALLQQSMHVEHERDAMSWRQEWIALPEINSYLSAQLQNALRVLRGLQVNAQQMRRNLDLQHGLLLSEKVMFEVGKRIGKQSAHALVYQCAMEAWEQQQAFKTVLLAHPELSAHIDADELDGWLDPEQYIGSVNEKIDQVIALANGSGLLEIGSGS
jgi:adenylosuccinate lyase